MNERTLRLRLGLFVLVAIILMASLILIFGSAPALFRRTDSYTIRFSDAPGVATGTPVRRSGVRIGEVTNIRLEDETGDVLVTVAIGKQYSVRQNEDPTLITGLFGSDTSIDFIPEPVKEGEPPPDRSPVPPGSELPGERQVTVNTLLTRASEVVPTTQETMNDIRKSMQRLEQMSPLVEDALKEGSELARVLRATVPDARRTLDEIRELARSARLVVPQVDRTTQEVQGFARAARAGVPDVLLTSEEIRELARVVREAVPDVRRTSDEIRELARATRETIPELRKTNEEIQGVARGVRESIPELRKTNEEFQGLVRSIREVMPDVQALVKGVRDAVPEARALIKSANDTMPEVRRTVEDFGAAARSWARVGERIDLLIQTNQDKVVQAIEKLNDVLGRVGTALSDENLRNLNLVLNNLREGSRRVPAIAQNADELLRQGRGTLQRLEGTLTKTEGFMSDIQRVTGPLGERGPTLMRNLEESSQRLNQTLGDVRELIRAVGQAEGTVNKLLTDPTLYQRLDNLLCQAGQVLPRFDRILKDFEVFADKLARHPESIGLGGVVRPSNGLKGPPASPGGTVIPPTAPEGMIIHPSGGPVVPPGPPEGLIIHPSYKSGK